MYEHISDDHKDGPINSNILFLHLGLKMIKQPYVKEIFLCDDVEFCREDKIGVSIIYAYEDSDVFYPAKLLKHGINCLCFASKEAIAMGEKIYIFTQDFPIESANLRIYEGCFAQVEECKKTDKFKNNPLYLIRGKSVIGNTMSIDSTDSSVKESKYGYKSFH
jgi:hypothetical protein